jgi:hypothetical protein
MPSSINISSGVFTEFDDPENNRSLSLEDISIPKSLIDIFRSGTSSFGDTTAGAFDIQPRSYAIEKIPQVMNGTPFPISMPKFHKFVMLDNQIEAVEGLIIDTRPGSASVGLRNHTLPSGVPGLWGTWKEVLFFSPAMLIL